MTLCIHIRRAFCFLSDRQNFQESEPDQDAPGSSVTNALKILSALNLSGQKISGTFLYIRKSADEKNLSAPLSSIVTLGGISPRDTIGLSVTDSSPDFLKQILWLLPQNPYPSLILYSEANKCPCKSDWTMGMLTSPGAGAAKMELSRGTTSDSVAFTYPRDSHLFGRHWIKIYEALKNNSHSMVKIRPEGNDQKNHLTVSGYEAGWLKFGQKIRESKDEYP